jgi:hypothetical protein
LKVENILISINDYFEKEERDKMKGSNSWDECILIFGEVKIAKKNIEGT